MKPLSIVLHTSLTILKAMIILKAQKSCILAVNVYFTNEILSILYTRHEVFPTG